MEQSTQAEETTTTTYPDPWQSVEQEENTQAAIEPNTVLPVRPTAAQQKASRLAKLEQRKKQIENQIKALEARDKEKDRRARTRRLVQLGALAEKYFACPGIEPEQFEVLLKKVVAALGEEKQADV